MMSSNIVAGSNVFLSREDDPLHDPYFVAQVQDYNRLKGINDRRKVDPSIPELNGAQSEILRTEMRCVYAKNDPCWGYIKSSNKVVSACINGACPKIKECNPKYTPEEAKSWRLSEADKRAYKDPKKLRCYYLVDMISDEEMGSYESNPINEGFEYTIHKNPVMVNKQNKKPQNKEFRIDPKTGKKMVVIGYEWRITDTALYENERLVPIWGYVDSVEKKQKEAKEAVASRKKAKKIEKKPVDLCEKARNSGDLIQNSDYGTKVDLEQAVASAIMDEVKLTDVNPNVIGNAQKTVVLLDNPAELAYVSGMFLKSGVEHGIATEHPIRLALIDDYPDFADWDEVILSNTALKRGCQESNVKAWEMLSKKYGITLLHVAERDFYNFTYGDQQNRWTCRNIYGVTHVCLKQSDISEIDRLPDGIYPVSLSLADDEKSYLILKKNENPIGRLGKEFIELIDALKKSEEISGFPANINGLALKVQRQKAEFLGMGHLIFSEY